MPLHPETPKEYYVYIQHRECIPHVAEKIDKTVEELEKYFDEYTEKGLVCVVRVNGFPPEELGLCEQQFDGMEGATCQHLTETFMSSPKTTFKRWL